MKSIIKNFFENNFFDKCIQNSFVNINCIIGSSALFFSLIILIFNIIALCKLIHFYKKLNFETYLILLSIFQVFIIQLVIITLYELLIAFFILIQTFIISLIIRKFVILSKKPKQILKKNGHFLFLNTINISLFLLYIMFLFRNNKDNSYSIMLIHSLFYLLTTIILTFYSISLVKLIKKYQDDKLNGSSKSTSESSVENNNSKSITILNIKDISNSNEIFYSMRKRQIKTLYRINMISALFEFLLILSILLFPYNNFKNSQFKITPDSLLDYILFYLYFFICLLNVSSNFLSFFWNIRIQYKEENNKNENYNKKNNKRVIDNRDIRRETINLKKEEPKQVNDFIDFDNTKEDHRQLKKSMYQSSFSDMSEEKEEDYYTKNENEEYDKNNKNNNDNSDKNKGQNNNNNNEPFVNKELLEPLNNNLIDRESIPYKIDSLCGINRITFLNNSQIDQDV